MKKGLITIAFLAAAQAFGQITAPIPQRKPTLANSKNASAKLISIDQAAKFVGDSVTIVDSVYSSRFIPGSNSITLLNLGGTYPNQKLTVVIKDAARKLFASAPEERFKGKRIVVAGRITEYRGKPQIEVSGPAQIKLLEELPSRKTD